VKSKQAKSDVQSAHDVVPGRQRQRFSFFGGRSGRSMRHFLDQIERSHVSDCRKTSRTPPAKFYRALRGRVEDRLRELSYCRTRLDMVVQAMESPLANLPVSSDTPISLSGGFAFQQTLHPTNTAQRGTPRRGQPTSTVPPRRW